MENSRLCQQDFPSVQRFVAFDLGLTLLPVRGQAEAGQLLSQNVSQEHTHHPSTLTHHPEAGLSACFPGSHGQPRKPVQEADLPSAVGPPGVGDAPAGPWGGPRQGSGSAAAIPQPAAAVQCCPRSAGAHCRPGCSAAHPPLLPQSNVCRGLQDRTSETRAFLTDLH